MAVTKFDDVVVKANGDLVVGGPFDPEGATIRREVTIRFLVIQEGEREGDPPVIVDGVASWTPTPSTSNWTVTVPASAETAKLRVGVDCRAVGQAIVIRDDVPPGDPPAFDTITWCVTRSVVHEE